jgi:SanA protein
MKLFKHLVIPGALIAGFLLVAPWFLRGWIQWLAKDDVYTVESVPGTPVALVLGAGLWRDGRPTPVLYDRVATAVDLYRAGRVKKLLMSGDNRFVNYNEPAAMHQLALQLGVPSEDIVLDYAGRRTYDSCYRARKIFGVTTLIIVTQRFHLDRALYLCNALGTEAVGVAADRRNYRPGSERFWQLREVAATFRAWLDVNFFKPQPVLGEKTPIEIADNN